MIYYDITKAGTIAHRSGLMRVSARLGDELRGAITEVRWDGGWRNAATGARVGPAGGDWVFTGELFSEEERPGFTTWLTSRSCRLGGIFHDAIPLKHPQITWPRSVQRHPGYMKLLAAFDRIWAVSAASRQDLLGYWQWLGIAHPPPVAVLALGANFDGSPRRAAASPPARALLCVGILEPRKNQEFLLGVCEELWREELDFELHLVGRVNPHFGRPIRETIRGLRRHRPDLHHHPAMEDASLARLYTGIRATVFPSRAEGCGLPLIESLWQGVPCVCSDLPVLRENADGGGCVTLPVAQAGVWRAALRRILTDDTWHAELAGAAATRPLPTWSDAAKTLRDGLCE